MSQLATTSLRDQTVEQYNLLHAADLDVWVASDGGTVIVIQGTGGHDTDPDPDPGDLDVPAVVPSPAETVNTVAPVTTIADTVDWSPVGGLTMSTTTTNTQSPVNLLTTAPSTEMPTLMSESQAPSSSTLFETSETVLMTTASMVLSSSSGFFSTSQSLLLSTSHPAPIVTSAEASTTVTAPPIPTSSDYLSRSPPYYIAIILGAIAGVAVLSALIAWALRRQAHERHRRLVDSAAKLPWVFPTTGGDDDPSSKPSVASNVEHAMMHTTDTEMGIMNLGSREDMAYVQSWEPRGDRDVGEPKRSEFYVDRKPPPPFITQQIPSYALFSRYSGQHLINDPDALPCGNRLSLGSIDPHVQAETFGKGSALLITNQVPGDLSVSSSQEVAFPCPSRRSLSPLPEIGTPRELVPMPRFLGLDGPGLSMPWEEKTLPFSEGPPTRQTKSRIMSAEHIRKTWERQASNRLEKPSTPADDEQPEQESQPEGWADSIKSNFVNAFNAVAASLPINNASKEGKQGSGSGSVSKFTPARPKRSSTRKALGLSGRTTREEANSKMVLSRSGTTKSSASDPWSLVQTGSNTGVIHIHLSNSDVHSVSNNLDLPNPSFGLPRSYSLHSPGPLQFHKKRSILHSRGRPSSISSRDSRLRAPFSRSSSAGGGGSGSVSVSPKRHRKAPGGSMKRKITLDRRSSPLFSRTTSMISSATSAVSSAIGTEDVREKRLLAREALKDRRRRANRMKEAPLVG